MKTTGFVTMTTAGRSHVHLDVTNTPPAAKPATPMAACTLTAPCQSCRSRAKGRADVDRFLAAERVENAREARIRRMDWVQGVLT